MASFGFVSAVRRFSVSSASLGKLVAPPVAVFGVDGRYAHAIYSAATKEKKLEVVEKDLKSIQSLLQSDTRFREFVVDPTLKRSVKQAAIEGLLKKQNCNNLTVNLFSALAENGRLNKIPQVLKAFSLLMGAHRGEVLCKVITAKPLDEKTMKELQQTLHGFLQKNQVLQLNTEVNPAIIGGMIVNIGDKFVDMSVATKIKTYTRLIKEAV